MNEDHHGLPGRPAPDFEDERLFASVHARLFGSREHVNIGRYRVEKRLGAGAMGVVYLVRDDDLDRSVALKLVHAHLADHGFTQRMRREAKALARLAHPNVVRVYEVGEFGAAGEQVFLVMEYVDGQSLRAWIDAAKPSWTALLDAYLDAGRGLAAAHGASLTHRDFKPDNVLRRGDGRVLVADFGLASLDEGGVTLLAEADLLAETDLLDETDQPRPLPEFALSRTGEIKGTPAYMPPEQFSGEPVDARADQFAFCVALYEGLWGERPFPESSLRARLRAIELHGPNPPKHLRGVPRPIWLVLRRGLAADPEARWPSMAALLEGLEASAARPQRRRRSVALGMSLGMTATLAAGGATLWRGEPDPAPIDRCARAGEPVAQIWAEPVRAELAAANPAIAGLLDDWASAWTKAATEACADVHLRERRTPASLEQRSLCLDRRLADFVVVVAGVRAGKPEQIEHLTDPRTCLDDRALVEATHARPPSGSGERVAKTRALLSSVRLGDADIRTRLARARAASAEAQQIGWPPLQAEAALALARLELHAQDPARTRAAIGEAIDIAETTGDNELLADAWTMKAKLARDLEFDVNGVGWALERRKAVLRRLDASPRQLGRLATERALWHQMSGRPNEAEQEFTAGDEWFRSAGPSAALEHGANLRDHGHLLATRGQTDAAKLLFTRAKAVEAPLGHVPPSSLDQFNEGLMLLFAGESGQAELLMLEALELARREYGTVSAQVAHIHVGLVAVYDQRGAIEQAGVHARVCAELGSLTLGPDDGRRADMLTAVGTVALRERRASEALAAFEQSLAIELRASSPDPGTLAMAQSNVAEAALLLGEVARAAQLASQSVAALAPANGPELVYPLKVAGAVELARGRPIEALELLERAHALHLRHPGNHVEAAEVLWLLTRADAAAGRTPEAVGTRREAARTAAAAMGEWWDWRLAEIDTWTITDTQTRTNK